MKDKDGPIEKVSMGANTALRSKQILTHSLPKEGSINELDGLEQFLLLSGHTLLVKGYAGAGKTTLAFQLLGNLGRGKEGAERVYISSRVSEDKIQVQIPSTRKMLSNRNFVDLRLGTPASIMEEVAGQLGKTSVSTRKSVGDKEGRSKSSSVIVLDTWDGLAKELDEVERLKAEKALIAMADASGSRIVFVSEEPGKTTMDYLVDGIVELARSEEYGRIFREIEIQKLRGVQIAQHKYLYTLLDGRFSYLPPYAEPDYSKAKEFEPTSDLRESRRYSFGCQGLDEIFGGIRKGSTFTIEYSHNVPYGAIRLLHVPPIINFLNLGRSVLFIPMLGAGVEEIESIIRPLVSEDAFRNRLRIATITSGDGEKLPPPLFSMGHSNVEEEHRRVLQLVDELKAKSVDRNVLIVDGMSFLENVFASRLDSLVEAIADRVIRTQRFGDAALFLLQTDSPIKSSVLSMSHSHARLFIKDRCVVLLGEKPNTEAYVLCHSKNPILPELTRIV